MQMHEGNYEGLKCISIIKFWTFHPHIWTFDPHIWTTAINVGVTIPFRLG